MQAIRTGVDCPEPDSCWLTAPPERSAKFLPAFARVSVAVQSALREQAPDLYFRNLKRFQDWKSAYPMLVYQASRPFRGRVRTELTYDVLNPALMTIFFRRARPNLAFVLTQAEARLQAQGLAELSLKYAARQAPEIIKAVQRLSASRRYLYLLVRSEMLLVEALVELSGLGISPPKEQAKRLGSFRKKWSFQFRRFYPGEDFSAIMPVVLEAATRALTSSRDADPEDDSGVDFVGSHEPRSGGS